MTALFIATCLVFILGTFLTSPTHSIHIISDFYSLPQLSTANFTSFIHVDPQTDKIDASKSKTKYILLYHPWQLPFIPGVFQWYYETRMFCEMKGSRSVMHESNDNVGSDFIMAIDASNDAEIPFRWKIRVTKPMVWDLEHDRLIEFNPPNEIRGRMQLKEKLDGVSCESVSEEKQKELDRMWRPIVGKEKDVYKVFRPLGLGIYAVTMLMILWTQFS